MYTARAPAQRTGPKFATGAGPWAKSSKSNESTRSNSESRVSLPLSRQGPELNGTNSPDGRVAASLETATIDPAPLIPYWSAKRHLTCGNPTPPPSWSSKRANSWRASASGKLKTAAAGLVICLNIDVDPPDIVKTNPCALLECWVDPHTLPTAKASEAIGMNLIHQFEGLSLKIQYKNISDPTFEDLRKSCQSLRRVAKDDAVLFYYNGHGVPKPTPSGELWCFNKQYTQYIPVSLTEVQAWVGSPGVYIWDCSAAGNLLTNFITFAERRDNDVRMQGGYAPGVQPVSSALQLAACASNEHLPSCPELPADLFTSCLTSPIDIALRFFTMTHQLPNDLTADMVMQLPGDLKDRRTPLGELNWIFTAITDTIAWTTFSREIFSRLYRSDLLIASLFRNFLLAERIMKNYNCTPHTHPSLPSTNTHSLWATWDLAVDTCLRQLPELLRTSHMPLASSSASSVALHSGRIGQAYTTPTPVRNGERPYTYVPSRFFADQLTAFEVWISRGGSALTRRGPMSLNPNADKSYSSEDLNGSNECENVTYLDNNLVPRKPPQQLPIVLQVLLSQPHRLRALILLSQFVDLGPWAVQLVLAIGIFPYITKLLQAPGPDLRPVLIFIWARILAVDPSVQNDLYNAQGYRYFANILGMQNDTNLLPNSSEHQAMCSFILAALSRGFPNGQNACWEEHVFIHCYQRLEEPDFLLRQWTALCIGQMWDSNDLGKTRGAEMETPDKLLNVLSDDSAEVRCAALFALGTFMGASGSSDPKSVGGGGSGTMSIFDEQTHLRKEISWVTGATLAIKDDASPMCRKELLVVISCLVNEWRGYFIVCAWIYWEEDRRWRACGGHLDPNEETITTRAKSEWLDTCAGENEDMRAQLSQLLSSFFTVFAILLDLSTDPYPEVSTHAQTIVDYIMALLFESPFTSLSSSSLNRSPSAPPGYRRSQNPGSQVNSVHSSPHLNHAVPAPNPRPAFTRNDSVVSTVSNTIRRTSSFANALKSLTGSIAFPSLDEQHITDEPVSFSRNEIQPSRPPSPALNMAQYIPPYSRPSTPPHNGTPTSERHSPSSELDNDDAPKFYPSNVIEALIDEDMERLRSRRRSRHHAPLVSSHSLPSPSNSTFSVDSTTSSVLMGLGTGLSIQNVLPLKSTYFDWCCEYFKEPQMRQTEADEPGSVQYNYQVWRLQRNETVDSQTYKQMQDASGLLWDRSVAHIQTLLNPLTMVFHSYDKHLIVANESDIVSVWDWSTRRRLSHFCNGNPAGTSITSMVIINEDIGGMLVTGSADGHVRLFRNYDPTMEQGPLQMVSAFRGLHEVIRLPQGAGMVMDWRQSTGILLVGGDSRVIKSWDAQTEMYGMDMDTDSDSPVTSMSSGPGSSHTFMAGFADGIVKVFDRRIEEEESIVRTYSDHTCWVQNVRPHPLFSSQFLSASLDGEIKLWDLRGPDVAVETWQMNNLSAFDVHPNAAVFAATSAITPNDWRNQRITLRSLDHSNKVTTLGIPTGHISPPPRSVPSMYIPRASSLVFHPTEMLYGIGEPDGTVRIMGCRV